MVYWGKAWETTVFIRVQWEWLGLLAGEIGLAILFFCYTVYATHEMGVKPLKSSSVATLLALDGQSRPAVEKVMENSITDQEKREEEASRVDKASVRLKLRDRRLILNEEKEADQQRLVSL